MSSTSNKNTSLWLAAGAVGSLVVAGCSYLAYVKTRKPKPLTAAEMYRRNLAKLLPKPNGNVVTLKDAHENDFLVLHDRVFDVSDYMHNHPGGADLIRDQFGKDATEEFDIAMHSHEAMELLENLMVGTLARA